MKREEGGGRDENIADNAHAGNKEGNMTVFRLVVFGLALALTPAGAARAKGLATQFLNLLYP